MPLLMRVTADACHCCHCDARCESCAQCASCALSAMSDVTDRAIQTIPLLLPMLRAMRFCACVLRVNCLCRVHCVRVCCACAVHSLHRVFPGNGSATGAAIGIGVPEVLQLVRLEMPFHSCNSCHAIGTGIVCMCTLCGMCGVCSMCSSICAVCMAAMTYGSHDLVMT
eukprot:1156149-Pelagomonas_calceolata.AAC.3